MTMYCISNILTDRSGADYRTRITSGDPYAKRIPPRAQKVKDELDVYLYRKRKEE